MTLPVMNTDSLTFSNVTNPDPNEILYAIPLGITSSLPWWTPFPSAFLDTVMAFKSITVDWDKDFGENQPGLWTEGLSGIEKATVALQVVELLYTVIQIFSGFAYLGQYSRRQQLLKYGSTTSYALVFSATVRLWTRPAFRYRIAQIVIWISALLSLLLFVLFHLPHLGTGPLYQLWAPGCIPWDSVTPTTWSCANATDLALNNTPHRLIPKQVDWGFAGCMAALLLWTAYIHLRFIFTKRVAYHQNIAGTIVYVLLVFVVTMVVFAFISDNSDSNVVGHFDIGADMTVCPGLSNSSLVQLVTDSAGYVNDSRCYDVTVYLPSVIPDLRTAIELDKANIAHLIFNF